ncbi:unnamed protein product [Cochlearia groenlandica]
MSSPKSLNRIIEDLPRGMLSLIMSREDIQTCILSCPELADAVNDFQVFRTMNLDDIVIAPLLVVTTFSFELVVRDSTKTTTFTVTDCVGQRLAGVSATNLAEHMIDESGGTHNLRFTPQTLLAVIGDQYTFQIRVSPDPIDIGNQTVAVTQQYSEGSLFWPIKCPQK